MAVKDIDEVGDLCWSSGEKNRFVTGIENKRNGTEENKFVKKKKIIIINHYGITPDMPGATKHYDLSEYFAAKNEYDIEFWMCGYNHATGKYIKELEGLRLQYSYMDHGVKIVKIKSIPDWGGAIIRQLNIMIFDFITSVKILKDKNIKGIILSIPPVTFFAADAAKIKKIKLIADVEDLWPLFMADMGLKNKIAVWYMEHFANNLYNKADAIEAVSEGMLKYVKRKVLNKKKKMWLAPLGVNLDLFEKKPDLSVIDKCDWKNDFKIIYAGAHGKANAIEEVLKTIEMLNEKYISVHGRKISFIFMGNGDNKEKLLELKETLKLKNVYFEDAVPGDKIPAILKNCDVCLTNLCKIRSFKLVRPNKIFQYMAASKPILCGIWGEAAHIVHEAKSGIYVDFTDYSLAAERIYRFIDRDDLEQMGKNGYDYIKENGDRNKIFKEFYQNVVEILNEHS